ncbi:MAG: FKBP-type peptidyl-prolyl cis-trans isomerase, partial [Clostridia bacterium]|nr:FKBP-type peptidyl-prolyl cis-trans isomerase [Clostridia bacterium]
TVIRAVALALAGVMAAASLVSCSGDMKSFDGDLRDRYDYNLKEYLKEGDYKGLKIKVGSDTISKEELDREIMQYNVLYTTTVEGVEWTRVGEGVPVERGNIAEVKYQGYLDGEPMTDLVHYKEEGYSMSIGSENLIPGIDQHIIGMTVGEKKTVEITVPDPCYEYPQYVGKTLTFDLELAGLRVTELQPYGEDLFNYYSSHNADEFEANLISEIKRIRSDKLEDYVITRVMSTVMETFKVKKYPEKELEEVKESVRAADEAAAEEAGVTFEEYIKTEYEVTSEEYDSELELYAQKLVFTEMVMYYIARKEQIALTSAAFDEKATELAEEVGLSTPAEYVNYMASYGYSEYAVREAVWGELVYDFLYDNAVQVKE